MNEELPFEFLEENDCRSYEMYLSEYREDIESFTRMISQKCEEEGICEETSFIVMAGRITELYLISYFYLSFFSYDPMLADPRIKFYHDRCEDDLFITRSVDVISDEKCEETDKTLKEITRKEAKEEAMKEEGDGKQMTEILFAEDIAVNEKVQSEVYVVLLFGDTVEKKRINTSENDLLINEYTGPIFITVNESLIVEINKCMKKVELPYKINPLDCDVIEAAAFKRENKSYLRIRRCQYPTRFYDILLDNE